MSLLMKLASHPHRW